MLKIQGPTTAPTYSKSGELIFVGHVAKPAGLQGRFGDFHIERITEKGRARFFLHHGILTKQRDRFTWTRLDLIVNTETWAVEEAKERLRQIKDERFARTWYPLNTATIPYAKRVREFLRRADQQPLPFAICDVGSTLMTFARANRKGDETGWFFSAKRATAKHVSRTIDTLKRDGLGEHRIAESLAILDRAFRMEIDIGRRKENPVVQWPEAKMLLDRLPTEKRDESDPDHRYGDFVADLERWGKKRPELKSEMDPVTGKWEFRETYAGPSASLRSLKPHKRRDVHRRAEAAIPEMQLDPIRKSHLIGTGRKKRQGREEKRVVTLNKRGDLHVPTIEMTIPPCSRAKAEAIVARRLEVMACEGDDFEPDLWGSRDVMSRRVRGVLIEQGRTKVEIRHRLHWVKRFLWSYTALHGDSVNDNPQAVGQPEVLLPGRLNASMMDDWVAFRRTRAIPELSLTKTPNPDLMQPAPGNRDADTRNDLVGARLVRRCKTISYRIL